MSHNFDPIRHKAATAVFKLAVKTQEAGMHRTINKKPKGKGWMPCEFGPDGMMYKPEKLNEAIAYFKIAYEVYADIVALNQVAIAYEMTGDRKSAADYYARMKRQADAEDNAVYSQTADMGLQRCG